MTDHTLTVITIPEHDENDIWMRQHIAALKVRGGREIVLRKIEANWVRQGSEHIYMVVVSDD